MGQRRIGRWAVQDDGIVLLTIWERSRGEMLGVGWG